MNISKNDFSFLCSKFVNMGQPVNFPLFLIIPQCAFDYGLEEHTIYKFQGKHYFDHPSFGKVEVVVSKNIGGVYGL